MPTRNLSVAAIRRHEKKWRDCDACGLGCEATTHVFYRGDLPCQVLYIGEAPGEIEDAYGEPFVGPAGELFDIFLADLLKYVRKEFKGRGGSSWNYTFAVANILCCFPRDENGSPRPPSRAEAEHCRPRLNEFIKIANPQIIVLMGKVSQTFIDPRIKDTITCTNIYHPSYWNRTGKTASVEYVRDKLRLGRFLKENL